MARYFSCAFFVYTLINLQYSCTAFGDGLTDIVGIGFFVYSFLYDGLTKTEVELTDTEMLVNKIDESTKKLMKELQAIMSIDKRIHEITRDIQEEVQKVPKLVLLEAAMNDVSSAISAVDNSYNTYLKYRNVLDHKRRIVTLESFANFTISPYGCGLTNHLLDIHSKLVPNSFRTNEKSTIPYLLINYMQHFTTTCNKHKSLSSMLYELYIAVTMTEIKGNVILRFAFDVLKTYYGGDYTIDLNLFNDDLRERHQATRLAFQKAMRFASRSVRTCEPPADKDALILKDYRRVYVPFLREMKPYSNGCNNDNKMFTPADLRTIQAEASNRNVPLGCLGNFRDCVDHDTNVCLARKYSSKNTVLRNERLYLRPENCNESTINYVDTTAYKTFTSYCLCTCQRYGRTYIDQEPVYSDYENNRVITGARISRREMGDMEIELFIEIREGELLSNGTINATSLTWKRNTPAPKITMNHGIIDWHSTRVGLFAQDSTDADHWFSPYMNEGRPVPPILTGLQFEIRRDVNKKEYFIINTYVSGAILNPPKVYDGFPKKAAYFVIPKDSLGKDGSNLQKFNPFFKYFPESEIGELQEPVTVTKLDMKDRDIIKTSAEPPTVDSTYHQYLNFEFTSFEKDLEQNIVPFIDMQPVVTDPPVPLAGAAFYHKGTKGHAGYLGLELRTFDFGKYVV